MDLLVHTLFGSEAATEITNTSSPAVLQWYHVPNGTFQIVYTSTEFMRYQFSVLNSNEKVLILHAEHPGLPVQRICVDTCAQQYIEIYTHHKVKAY